MAGNGYRSLIRGALLLSLVLVFQSLRLVLPLPPFVSTFIIGTLVNAGLVLAVLLVGVRAALVIALVAPLVALLQGKLALMVFVPLVAVGNMLYVWLASYVLRFNKYLVLGVAGLVKTTILAGGSWLILNMFEFSPLAAKALAATLGWPQFITSVTGGLLAVFLLPRLGRKSKDSS